jgi:hypothetical protein
VLVINLNYFIKIVFKKVNILKIVVIRDYYLSGFLKYKIFRKSYKIDISKNLNNKNNNE